MGLIAGNNKFLKLFKVWMKISFLAAESQLLTNWSGVLFLIGKIVRFFMYFIFLFSVLSGAKDLIGLSQNQVIFFFLIFNFIDITVQFLFRGVYHFRPLVVSGNFDLDLLKPIPSFFKPIFGWTDILDFITLVPLVLYIFHFSLVNHLAAGFFSWLLFLFLLINAILISFAIHLAVCAICILTLEIDHLIWVYRDLTNMGRFPTDIYPKWLQGILTFTIPVVVMVTVPTKSLLGIVSWPMLALSFLIGAFSLFASLKFWQFSLKRYTSASS
ncbi:hypothetical protein COT64_03420 [Candidatus Shapirobacteria bacterium CG09_land_8_20_14_0_10_39_12]|uniref:ABC transporter permease n=1 Tax=Candidatus Shapirobacteria bacterium CG09_land_8_20_14_0_10_39_12 TaxID=1974885 RepID=A0A2H0WNT8_9BACT|nr:MAG: hypothetical protein COT64_03420 [Candidatus Shapirobacteria bacterium CG09_land_8_20_14_0_10_39_12]